MEATDLIKYACITFYTVGSFGGLIYLINLIRRNRRDNVQQVQVLPTTPAAQQPERRVPVRPAPRREP